MALYAIGYLHLSLNSDKSMEVFVPAWENYTERIRASLSPGSDTHLKGHVLIPRAVILHIGLLLYEAK